MSYTMHLAAVRCTHCLSSDLVEVEPDHLSPVFTLDCNECGGVMILLGDCPERDPFELVDTGEAVA